MSDHDSDIDAAYPVITEVEGRVSGLKIVLWYGKRTSMFVLMCIYICMFV